MSNQVYGYITDKILEELERGCVPWHQPWKSPDGVRVPTSFVSKKPYRGVNTFLLAVSRVKAGYSSNYWLTFKQIQALGGSVKGQHSEMIVFWKVLEKPAENPTPALADGSVGRGKCRTAGNPFRATFKDHSVPSI